jgi:putative addiction module killer protein
VEARKRTVEYYLPVSGPAPFGVWRDSLTDSRVKAAVAARIARLEGGNFGKSDPIGDGAAESKIDLGPGYRIYYGVDGLKIVLLFGGDKSTQQSDIETAKGFWNKHKERKKKNEKPKLQSRSARRSSKRPRIR